MAELGPETRLCIECGSSRFYARERCNTCYIRLRKALRRSGQFELRLVHGKPLERLQSRAVPSLNGCLLYTGTLNNRGYGQISVNGAQVLAHRAMYELTVGPIPDGLALDHLCHNRDPNCMGGPTCLHRRCVNVEHLEPVTKEENSRRGRGGANNAVKTHCPAGHPYDETNTHVYRGTRHCRACNRAHKKVS